LVLAIRVRRGDGGPARGRVEGDGHARDRFLAGLADAVAVAVLVDVTGDRVGRRRLLALAEVEANAAVATAQVDVDDGVIDDLAGDLAIDHARSVDRADVPGGLRLGDVVEAWPQVAESVGAVRAAGGDDGDV